MNRAGEVIVGLDIGTTKIAAVVGEVSDHGIDIIGPWNAVTQLVYDAGFGIDMLRLEAVQTEPIHARTAVGHLEAGATVSRRLAANTALDDLIGRIGARVGLEAILRLHPADSHIPEKTANMLAAAWSQPHDGSWPAPGR